MIEKKTIWLIGKLMTVGLVIQNISSTCFESFQWYIKEYMTVRDFICLLGQDVGECFYVAGFWILFKKIGFFKAICEFWFDLILIDLCSIIFTNPYTYSLPKYAGYSFAVLILIIRYGHYKNLKQ